MYWTVLSVPPLYVPTRPAVRLILLTLEIYCDHPLNRHTCRPRPWARWWAQKHGLPKGQLKICTLNVTVGSGFSFEPSEMTGFATHCETDVPSRQHCEIKLSWSHSSPPLAQGVDLPNNDKRDSIAEAIEMRPTIARFDFMSSIVRPIGLLSEWRTWLSTDHVIYTFRAPRCMFQPGLKFVHLWGLSL